MAKVWSVAFGLVVAACGTNSAAPSASDASHPEDTAGADGGQPNASADEPTDASAYLACFSATGQLSAGLKGCQADVDCVSKVEFTDCCGSILYAGVSAVSAARFDACDKAWQAHFLGPCQCPPKGTVTEDGKMIIGVDASSPQVHCASGACMTYLPNASADAGDGSAEAASNEAGDARSE
jgi:hypothetical protein